MLDEPLGSVWAVGEALPRAAPRFSASPGPGGASCSPQTPLSLCRGVSPASTPFSEPLLLLEEEAGGRMGSDPGSGQVCPPKPAPAQEQVWLHPLPPLKAVRAQDPQKMFLTQLVPCHGQEEKSPCLTRCPGAILIPRKAFVAKCPRSVGSRAALVVPRHCWGFVWRSVRKGAFCRALRGRASSGCAGVVLGALVRPLGVLLAQRMLRGSQALAEGAGAHLAEGAA